MITKNDRTEEKLTGRPTRLEIEVLVNEARIKRSTELAASLRLVSKLFSTWRPGFDAWKAGVKTKMKKLALDNAALIVVAALIFVVVVWAVPILLAPRLHSDSIVRAAAVVTLLVSATVATTIATRS